jgi:hypothetical protein
VVGEGFKWGEMELSDGVLGDSENERERELDTSLPASRKGNSVESERKRLRANTAGRLQMSSASVEHCVPDASANYCYRRRGAGVAAAGDDEPSRALEARLGAMVVAAGLEPFAEPVSLRAEGNQVLADGQADRQEAEGRE